MQNLTAQQNETAQKNQTTGNNPDNFQPSYDDNKNVTKLSKTTVYRKDLSAKEEKLAALMSDLLSCEEDINKMQTSVTSSNSNLTPIAKEKIRNDIRMEKSEKKILKAQISRLSKELKKEYKRNAQSLARKSLSISARKESFHKRYGSAVRIAITKAIAAIEKGNLDALKSELANLSEKDADTLLMKTLLKAPRHLHTKVVANKDAREGYLQHFRDELGIASKNTKGGRRK